MPRAVRYGEHRQTWVGYRAGKCDGSKGANLGSTDHLPGNKSSLDYNLTTLESRSLFHVHVYLITQPSSVHKGLRRSPDKLKGPITTL